MKTGEVAKIIGVSSRTITDWTTRPEFENYFSMSALMDDDSKIRDYTPEDILVLNTISKRKTRNNSWNDVAAILDSGEREDLDPSSMLNQKSITPGEHLNKLAEITKERDFLAAQLDDARHEIERLREQVSRVRREEDERAENLRREIIELNRRIAVLEYRLEEEEE